jgi:hypothetical protein
MRSAASAGADAFPRRYRPRRSGGRIEEKMSLDSLNRIVGEAIVNASFCRSLLSDPRSAVRDFELGADELAVISSIRAGSVDSLAQQILAGLELDRANPLLHSDPGGRRLGTGGGQNRAQSSTQTPRIPAEPAIAKAALRLSAC